MDRYFYAGNAIVFIEAVRPEIEGEEFFPVQVRTVLCYCYCGRVVIFIVVATRIIAEPVPIN